MYCVNTAAAYDYLDRQCAYADAYERHQYEVEWEWREDIALALVYDELYQMCGGWDAPNQQDIWDRLTEAWGEKRPFELDCVIAWRPGEIAAANTHDMINREAERRADDELWG